MQSVHVSVPKVALRRLAGRLVDVQIEAAHPNSLTGRLDIAPQTGPQPTPRTLPGRGLSARITA
jgi:hypothetical protein